MKANTLLRKAVDGFNTAYAWVLEDESLNQAFEEGVSCADFIEQQWDYYTGFSGPNLFSKKDLEEACVALYEEHGASLEGASTERYIVGFEHLPRSQWEVFETQEEAEEAALELAEKLAEERFEDDVPDVWGYEEYENGRAVYGGACPMDDPGIEWPIWELVEQELRRK